MYKQGVSREINFGFESPTGDTSVERQISLQLNRTNKSTRIVSTVPLQVTTIQYSSDSRIKKEIVDVDTTELLDRLRQIELREYGYTDEWRRVRGLEMNDVR